LNQYRTEQARLAYNNPVVASPFSEVGGETR